MVRSSTCLTEMFNKKTCAATKKGSKRWIWAHFFATRIRIRWKWLGLSITIYEKKGQPMTMDVNPPRYFSDFFGAEPDPENSLTSAVRALRALLGLRGHLRGGQRSHGAILGLWGAPKNRVAGFEELTSFLTRDLRQGIIWNNCNLTS